MKGIKNQATQEIFYNSDKKCPSIIYIKVQHKIHKIFEQSTKDI